jgi:hypothetical protein
VVCRAAKIDQGKIEFLGVLMNSGASPDDLLELSHRTNRAVEHDQAAGLSVHPG